MIYLLMPVPFLNVSTVWQWTLLRTFRRNLLPPSAGLEGKP